MEKLKLNDTEYLDILDFIDPLIIIKDKDHKFKAFNLDKIEDEFYTSHDDYMKNTVELIGEGETPMEAVKDLFWKIK